MYDIQILGVSEFLGATETAPEVVALANAQAMELSVRLVEAGAKAHVPRRTGRLFSSIEGHVETLPGVVEGKVGTGVEYAQAVEFGAVAHEIAPSTGLALSFEIGGRSVVTRRVHHPGNQPHPYLGLALEEARGGIRALFRAAADKLVSHLAK